MRVSDVINICRKRAEAERNELWWEQFYRDLGLAATGIIIWGALFYAAMITR